MHPVRGKPLRAEARLSLAMGGPTSRALLHDDSTLCARYCVHEIDSILQH